MVKREKAAKELNLDLEPTAGAFAVAVAQGQAREYACYGARGDGKTFAALIAMILHAQQHHNAGYPLPVPWFGVADTFRSHELKTCRSLELPVWAGAWRLYDNNHLAVFRQGRSDLVHLDLFGIEDQGAMDRVRMETVGIWFEEPAPSAVLVQSSGISDTAWIIGLTSQGDSRIKSHCYPAIMTSNLPDEDHWSWKRFSPGPATQGVHPDHPERMWFRIPPGERASEEDRAQWAKALEDRPDLLARLLDGKPGSIVLGPQVAAGFNELRHVSRTRLKPVRDEPLYISFDFGLTPACIIGQELQGRILIYAALPCARGGIRQHIEHTVRPWLTRNAPWAFSHTSMILGAYDPAGDTPEQADIDQSPMLMVESLLPGYWEGGAISWEGRKNPMLALFNRAVAGEPTLQVDPVDGRPLIQALNGRWHYLQNKLGEVSRDMPVKNHPWSDLGDAFCYLIGRITPETSGYYNDEKITVLSNMR